MGSHHRGLWGCVVGMSLKADVKVAIMDIRALVVVDKKSEYWHKIKSNGECLSVSICLCYLMHTYEGALQSSGGEFTWQTSNSYCDSQETESPVNSPQVPPSFSRVIYTSGDKKEVTYKRVYLSPQLWGWRFVFWIWFHSFYYGLGDPKCLLTEKTCVELTQDIMVLLLFYFCPTQTFEIYIHKYLRDTTNVIFSFFQLLTSTDDLSYPADEVGCLTATCGFLLLPHAWTCQI